jgi:hypothetical protein
MPMKISPTTLALMVILAGAVASTPVGADELTTRGRAVFAKNRQAVVTVELTLKNTYPPLPGQPKGMSKTGESKQDATGMVIDPSGLAVLSLSATDPSEFLQNMVSAVSEGDPRFKMQSELIDLKILLEDGAEVPAEVVLRDPDLDLAFIRPKLKPATPMAAVDLAGAGQADVLDQVVSLNRLGKATSRAYAASAERISAVVQEPRLFYVPETSATLTSLGSPAFTLDGKPLGIFVMRALKGKGSMSMLKLQPDNVTGIILPAAEILNAAKQIPPAAEEKKGK